MNVKISSACYFAKGKDIERINMDPVKNLVLWHEKNFAWFVCISTGSVIGGRNFVISAVAV